MANTEPSTPPPSDEPLSELRALGATVELRLLYRQCFIALREGELYLGRSPDCELAISDPTVSRRHARLSVSATQIVIEDLASANGVYVNGHRIDAPRELKAGDQIRVSHHVLEVTGPEGAAAPLSNRYHITAETLSGAERTTLIDELHERVPKSADSPYSSRFEAPTSRPPRSTRLNTGPPRSDSLAKSAAALDDALVRGEVSEVERRLAPILMRVHQLLLAGDDIGAELAEHVVITAARLASETRNPVWMNYAVTLYATLRRPLPNPAVDAIHVLVQSGFLPNMGALSDYLALLDTDIARLEQSERSLVDRLRRVVLHA